MAQLARIIVLAATGLLPACATTIYTDSSSFLAVLASGYKLETFSSITASNTLAASASYNGFTATSTPDSALYGLSTGALSTVGSGDTLVLTFSGSVTAVGFNVYLTDLPGDSQTGSLEVTLSDGTTQTIVVSNPSTTAFIGFTTSGGEYVTSVSIKSSTTEEYPTIDNVYSGQAVSASAVPEPTSFMLAGGALFVLIAWRRRKGNAPLAPIAGRAPAI